MRHDDEFEVVWSGELDAIEACPSLSGYSGPSSLQTWAPIETLTCGDIAAVQKAMQTGKYRRKKKYDDLIEKEVA